MSPNKARNLLRSLGCGPTRHILSEVMHPKPKSKPKPKPEPNTLGSPNGSSSTTTTTTTTTTTSYWKMEESVAVVKETMDPYEEFRYSMLQMIFEKEIFLPQDLHRLLCCFLRLNSPSHHDIIIRAFFDVCNDVIFDVSSPATSTTTPPKKNVAGDYR